MKLRRIEADSPELEQFIEGTYTDQKQFEGQVANIAEEVRKRATWPYLTLQPNMTALL